MLRALLATLLCAFVPASAPTTGLPHYPDVVQVICSDARGSAFRINDHQLLTAAHVTSNTGCKINGQPIVGVSEKDLDFAVIELPGHGGMKVNCGGFQTGTYVFGVGFAGGNEWQTMTRHYVTYKDTYDGMRYLLGFPSVIPGMSGGVVMNSAGEAVGVVNRYNPGLPLSYSRPLKDTSVCRLRGAALTN